MNHFKKAEEHLREAEAEFDLVRTNTIDPNLHDVYLQSAGYRLSFAQAHIGLAQVQGYGQVQGSVEKMVDKLPAEGTGQPTNHEVTYTPWSDVGAGQPTREGEGNGLPA